MIWGDGRSLWIFPTLILLTNFHCWICCIIWLSESHQTHEQDSCACLHFFSFFLFWPSFLLIKKPNWDFDWTNCVPVTFSRPFSPSPTLSRWRKLHQSIFPRHMYLFKWTVCIILHLHNWFPMKCFSPWEVETNRPHPPKCHVCNNAHVCNVCFCFYP